MAWELLRLFNFKTQQIRMNQCQIILDAFHENTYLKLALLQALTPKILEITESDATAGKSVIEHEQEKYICGSKGGYFSTTLGCFE